MPRQAGGRCLRTAVPGSVPGAPRGREQGRSPLPSLLLQVHKTLPSPKLLKHAKRRILRLQALARQWWWVLVAKEPPSLQPTPAGDVPRGPIAPGLSPGSERGQGCRDPRPTGPLGWPGKDQCTFLLGFRLRICVLALEAAEAAASSVDVGMKADQDGEVAMEVEVEMEVEMAMEVDMEVEMEMEIDPPAAGQVRAPHPLPAVPVGCLLPGWGWGGWAPLQGYGARSVPSCWRHNHHHRTALSTRPLWEGSHFLGPGKPSLTLSPAGA